jgi:hypothetical protein
MAGQPRGVTVADQGLGAPDRHYLAAVMGSDLGAQNVPIGTPMPDG